MNKITITTKNACFGVGMVLDLTQNQAEARKDSLGKRGKYYVVNVPIYFKKGEEVVVVSGNLSKKLLADVKKTEENTSSPPPTTPTAEFPCMKHMGFGKYDVFNVNGEKVNETQLTKKNAEELLKTLEENKEDDL